MQSKEASEHLCWLHPSHASHCLRKLTLIKDVERFSRREWSIWYSQPFSNSKTLAWTAHWADSDTAYKYCKSNPIWAHLVLRFPPKTTGVKRLAECLQCVHCQQHLAIPGWRRMLRIRGTWFELFIHIEHCVNVTRTCQWHVLILVTTMSKDLNTSST